MGYPITLTTLCPKSHKPIIEYENYWWLPGYPPVYCNKVHFGRTMTLEEYMLIFNNNSPVLSGFISPNKQTEYSGVMRLDTEANKFRVMSAERKTLGNNCPKSGKPVEELPSYYDFPGFKNLRCWKSISGRDMTVEDYISILKVPGAAVEFHNFHAKEGNRPYSAKLRYDDTVNQITKVNKPKALPSPNEPEDRATLKTGLGDW